MSWGVLNAAVLVGLVGVAQPVLIHLLNRRRGEVIDWGAMQFLEPGRRAQRRIKLAEILLMAARMALLGLVVLALAPPIWLLKASSEAVAGAGLGLDGPPRAVVIILDVSESMERKLGDSSAFVRAVAWARSFVARCRPGDSIAILLAGDAVQRLIDPPTYDLGKVQTLFDALKPPRGASDLAAALAESLRILERTENPGRDVIVLSDGQRFPWRPGETGRWDLLRTLRSRMTVPPRIWSSWFEPGKSNDASAANASVAKLTVSRSLLTPGLPLDVTADVSNAGPGEFSGSAELLVDDNLASGTPQVVPPIPAGGRVPVHFRTSFSRHGSHVLAVRIAGGDAREAGHTRAVPVQVAPAIPVLLVNGEPGVEPFTGETDFLRAALAPSGDETPQFRISVVSGRELSSRSLEGMKVAVLANVDRISSEQSAAIGDYLGAGGPAGGAGRPDRDIGMEQRRLAAGPVHERERDCVRRESRRASFSADIQRAAHERAGPGRFTGPGRGRFFLVCQT